MHIVVLLVLYSNNAKRFLVSFSQSWNMFYLKSFKKPCFYDAHTEGGLVSSLVFADSIVFKY